MNRQIDIMGIVNLTDDSYFTESRCADPTAALRRIERMVEDGADIIDLGACSTRPGSLPVGEEEEWRRLHAVLPLIRAHFPDVRISVDTYFSSVVEKTYDLIGDFIVNDISAGEDDPDMLPTVGRLGLEYVAMHKRGTPQTMQSMTDYGDVVAEVIGYFQDFATKAHENGIKNWILDPGFGFAKTIEQNYCLLSHLCDIIDGVKEIPEQVGNDGGTSLRDASESWQSPSRILVGISRKSMIYKLLGITPEDSLSATQALHMAALMGGADILRVHDVKEAKQTATLYHALNKEGVDIFVKKM
ncbi:MAG: dihydropteroate synthase [Bacteroidales bacterium]|nr:dihydropteroate synthase [Bacteroidales bacterium]